jgi:rhodanese-related sulfurtransferase
LSDRRSAFVAAAHPLRRRRVLCASLGLAVVGPWVAACSGPDEPTAGSPDAVSLDEARAALAAGRAVVIDIRERDEHAKGVAEGARLLPMSQLRLRAAEIPTDPATPVLLICHMQNRSSATLKALRQGGYGHVRHVHGGMSGWVRRGWPVVAPGS